MSWNYYGNEAAVALLRSHVARGQVRQAYLFCGPSGVGRRTLALQLAQALNCLHPPQPGDFCGHCRPCALFGAMRHPDLDVAEAEQRYGVLRIEQIRQLQHRLSLSPFEARYRIGLILRSEEANLSAQNALLKTLEEPPPRAVLLLTAVNCESLLATVVSRCEVLSLRAMSPAALAQRLIEDKHCDPLLAAQLARLAAGRPGEALRLLDHPEQRLALLHTLEAHLDLLRSSWIERFALAERLAKRGSKAEMIPQLEQWIAFWRDVLLCRFSARAELTYPEFADQSAEIAAQVGERQILHVLHELQQMLQILRGNVNLRLALEVLFLKLPRVTLREQAAPLVPDSPKGR